MACSGAQEAGVPADAAQRTALRRHRTLSLQRSRDARVGQLAPGAAEALSSLALGAPPPPFVFPALLDAEQDQPTRAEEVQQAQASAAAVDQPQQQLIDLLLAQQQLREQRQLKLQDRAAAILLWLTPWRRVGSSSAGRAPAALGGAARPLQAAMSTSAHRQGSGSRRYPAARAPADQPRLAAQSQDLRGDDWNPGQDETYSWHEFFDTLRLVGLDPDGRLVSSGRRRGIGEGMEAPAPPEERSTAAAFSAGLASLIAEAEELTGAGASAQRQEPPSPGVTFPALQPFALDASAASTAPLPPRQLRMSAAPALAVRLGDAGANADGGVRERDGPSGSGASSAPSVPDPVTPHIQWQRLKDDEAQTSQPGSQAGPALGSPRGPALAGNAPSTLQMAAERHKSPRGGRVCFVNDPGSQDGRDLFGAAFATLAQGGARTAGGDAGGRQTAGMSAAGGSSGGGGAGGGGGGGGGVRFADAVATPGHVSGSGTGKQDDIGKGTASMEVVVASAIQSKPVRQAGSMASGNKPRNYLPHTLLLSVTGDVEGLLGLREPSITVKALRRKREAAAVSADSVSLGCRRVLCSPFPDSKRVPLCPKTPTVQGDSLRASPLPGQANVPGATGVPSGAPSASRPSSAGGTASRSESVSSRVSSHISSGTSITGRRSSGWEFGV
jgi:hypothetical protein